MEEKISKNVLEQIQSGQVKMHSRIYFVLRAILSAVAILLVAVPAWFFFSLVVFSLARKGALYMAFFGPAGIKTLLFSFPWIIFAIGLGLFFLLDKLLANYALAYRRPALYTFLGVSGFLAVFVVAVHFAGLNNRMHESVMAAKYPGISKLYELGPERLGRGVVSGRVEAVSREGVLLVTMEGERAFLRTTPRTRYSNCANLQEGEIVVAGVEKNGSEYSAYGIRKVQKPLVKGLMQKRLTNPGEF